MVHQRAFFAMGGFQGSVGLSALVLPMAGSYTVVLTPGGGGTGSANVMLSTDQTGTLVSGTSDLVVIDTPGQNAELTFGATPGQKVNIEVTNSTFNGCLSLTLSLLKPDGTQLATNSMCFQGSVGLSALVLPIAGSYTVVLTPGGGGTGSANVEMSFIGTPASTPNFSLTAGTYPIAQTLILTDTTAGATIFYTTDGTAPTSGSTQYAGPITVSSNEMIQTIASALNYSDSAVGTAAYVIAAPAISTLFPSSGVPGVTLRVTGSHFGTNQSANVITLNGEVLMPSGCDLLP